MTLAGYPILTFAPLIVAVVATLIFVQGLGAMSRQLDLKDGESTPILLAGEGRLRELGVHSLVWRLRLLWAVEAAAIIAFVYLMYRAEVV